MIKNIKALNLAEVEEILKEYPQLEENASAKNTSEYIKKFIKAKHEKVEELKKSIKELNLDKLKDKHIAKIVDIMPEDPDDLKKIFIGEDFTLEQDEISAILGKIKGK